MSNEERANKEMMEGEKILKAFRLFGNKFEDAVERFEKAANLYKMAKEWQKAGDAWKRVSDCYFALKSGHEAATALVEASKCYQKINPQESIKMLLHAIDYYLEDGKFSIAARHQKAVAEMYENEGDIQNATEHYEKAGELYDGENSVSSSNACKLKVAEYSAQLNNFAKAIEIYEKVAIASLDNNLLKWSAKDYFLRAGICHLCLDDIVSAKRALQKYKDIDINFGSQRECTLLENIMDAYEKYDVDAFTNAVREYDSISKLDSWKTNLLLKIKTNMNQEEELF
eukprot:TRINITY_DN6664_c0_g2_i1.p1 TRINITY_DN6664_c0_g2~~TRINITY_DN6664_c0_g2_i1.p1  ORF type:complete len:302 (-),score=95.25 TRINITY_DN6664_c0_g2_i1:118-972(-)